jgi:hypothetical protein
MTNADTDMLMDLSRMERAVVRRIAARQTGEVQQRGPSVETRMFGDRVKYLPTVDGLPAEGGESEDYCSDYEDEALAIACRRARMHGRAG